MNHVVKNPERSPQGKGKGKQKNHLGFKPVRSPVGKAFLVITESVTNSLLGNPMGKAWKI